MKSSIKEKVIVILCDTLRAKSLLHYGNKRNTTPNLSAVIDRDFTVYKRAYAPAPWTPPSHLSLFTGLYPSQAMETEASSNLHPVFKTLPALFKDSGYKTFGFVTNELISRQSGFGNGFDAFFQYWLPNPEDDELFLHPKGEGRIERSMEMLGLLSGRETRSRTLQCLRQKIFKKYRDILKDSTPSTNRSMELLEKYTYENLDENIFCFVNLMQAHNLYNPPRETRNTFTRYNAAHERYYKKRIPLDHYAIELYSDDLIEYLKLRYEEETLYLDIVISDYIAFLKERGLYDNCTIIITSDHGEHFGENGHIAHAFSVFEPLIKIPLYIKWSGESENRQKEIDKLVMLHDLYSTFLNRLKHWQPVPESSIDLLSSIKRSFVISQLPDMSQNIKGCQNRNSSFSINDLGLQDTSLNAYIFDNGTKIIENGGDFSCFDLNNDPDESSPSPINNEQRILIEKIMADIA